MQLLAKSNNHSTSQSTNSNKQIMAPFSGGNGQSNDSLHKDTARMSSAREKNDAGSIGSDTFRSQRRRAFEQCETDEQLFNQHNNQSIYDNRHHDANYDDDLNSAESSLGGYSDLGGGGDNASKGGGSVRTRDELRLSLIARRRRLAQMENAMEGDASIDFSLRLNRPNRDAGSLVSSLRDSIISFNDSLQGSLLSRKRKKKSKDKKSKKSKKKSSSKDQEREKRKEKERREKEKKKKKRKEKEKEKHHKSKKSKKKSRSSKHQQESSDESSSDSESEESEAEYSKQSKQRPTQNGHDRDRRQQQRRGNPDDYATGSTRGGDKGRSNKAMLKRGGSSSVRKPMQNQEALPPRNDRDRPSFNNASGVVYYACDEHTGMCAYHPDIQLRKKSRFGGWKDVLKQCPRCAAEQKRGSSGGGGIDRSNRSARGGIVVPSRDGDRGNMRQADRGMPRNGQSSRAIASQRQQPPTDNRRRGKVESDSSSSSSSSDSSAPSKRKVAQQPQQSQHQRPGNNRRGEPQRRGENNMGGRRGPGDPRGTSQPPRQGMARRQPQRGSSQRGTSLASRAHSTKAGAASGRQPRQQQNSRRQSYRDPPGSGRDIDPSLAKSQGTQKMGRDRPSRGASHAQPKQPSKSDSKRAGRERTVSHEPTSRALSVSSQRLLSNVDFDPPPPTNQSQRKPNASRADGDFGHSLQESAFMPNNNYEKRKSQGTDDGSHAIGGESDFALFQGRGGKAYNEEGMYSFFKDNMNQGNNNNNSTPAYEEEKKEQRLMNRSENDMGVESYGARNTQKMRSNTFHGASSPSSQSRKAISAEQQRQSQKPVPSNLEGISAEDLMHFVMAQSAHFDESTENLGELEQALMAQVARLSIGSGDGDLPEGNIEDAKFSVLREVVKSYMNGEKSKNNGSSVENVNQQRNGLRSGEEDSGHNGDNSPKRDCHNYNLGDEGRRRDMIKDDDKDVALMRIASLQPGDPAFIRRTTGKWTFSKVKNVASDSIVFIVNPNGSSKAYNVKYWVSHIRTRKALANTSPDDDPSGRRGAFAKQLSATRFSIKGLRPSTPRDDDEG